MPSPPCRSEPSRKSSKADRLPPGAPGQGRRIRLSGAKAGLWAGPWRAARPPAVLPNPSCRGQRVSSPQAGSLFEWSALDSLNGVFIDSRSQHPKFAPLLPGPVSPSYLPRRQRFSPPQGVFLAMRLAPDLPGSASSPPCKPVPISNGSRFILPSRPLAGGGRASSMAIFMGLSPCYCMTASWGWRPLHPAIGGVWLLPVCPSVAALSCGAPPTPAFSGPRGLRVLLYCAENLH